jgi:hypothetical protein
MCKVKSKQNRKNNEKMSWDKAIAEAKERIRDFQRAIKVYREAKKRGEVWPGVPDITATNEPWPVSGNKVTKAGKDGESVPA